MPERTWALIGNGETFEALVRTLVHFEDPNAVLLGRRGKDGGQDIRSGDGQRVFQVKHHEKPTPAKAIGDAKSEAAKVTKYRDPQHQRYAQWSSVKQWRLVTNASFNTTDQQRWTDEIVPLFSALGLAVDYWEVANLDARLVKHPEVGRAFFGGRTRAFLTLPEANVAARKGLPLGARSPQTFVGRDELLGRAVAFLASEKAFLALRGEGGVGKTRLLLELGERSADDGREVYWANIATMETDSAWFGGLVPERPALLLIDEPDSETVLRALVEQLEGRAARWKVAVAVRSPKDPVFRFLRSPKLSHRVEELEVKPLGRTSAEALCAELLGGGALGSWGLERVVEAASWLAVRFSNLPVWMTLAVRALEKKRSLAEMPDDVAGLAELYIEEIVAQDSVDSGSLRSVLEWIALYGVVNREDDATVASIALAVGLHGADKLRSVLASTVKRGGLAQRGARGRLVEVRPDVLRDHLLRTWLTVDVGYGTRPIRRSSAADGLVESVVESIRSGHVTTSARAVLRALARTELLLDLSKVRVGLLQPLVAALESGIPSTGAASRAALADVLLEVAEVRPDDVVAISSQMRRNPVEPEVVEGLLGDRTFDQVDVVHELAWAVFHAARGARTAEQRRAVIEELYALADIEAEASGNDARAHLLRSGRRASDLLVRPLGGGPQYRGDFEDAARDLALRDLARLKSGGDARPSAALGALLDVLCSVVREQTWSEGFSLNIRKQILRPIGDRWDGRTALLEGVREAITSEATPLPWRCRLWEVLDVAHGSVLRSVAKLDDGDAAVFNSELVEDLRWALEILAGGTPDLEELRAARKLWDWHLRFDADPDVKVVAARLEELYLRNDLAAEFEPITAYTDDLESRCDAAGAKARQLAEASDSAAVARFTERAEQFLGPGKVNEVLHVAWHLGRLVPEHTPLGDFIRSALGGEGGPSSLAFASVAALTWLAEVRGADPADASELVRSLMGACASPSEQVVLLSELYGRQPQPPESNDRTADEDDLLRAQRAIFLSTGTAPQYLRAVAGRFEHDWPGLRALVEGVLAEVDDTHVGAALSAVIDAVFWGVRDAKKGGAQPPPDLAGWLVCLLARRRLRNGIGDHGEWHLGQIVEKVGRPSIEQLAALIEAGEELPGLGWYGFGSRKSVGTLFAPVTPESSGQKRTRGAVEKLVDALAGGAPVPFDLGELLGAVDPDGLLVPEFVREAIRNWPVGDAEAASPLACVARHYEMGGPAWRRIADATAGLAKRSPDDSRARLYGALDGTRPRAWGSAIGEVPAHFTRRVVRAREGLASESEEALRQFWTWHLAVCERELRRAEEKAREERGE
jgi:hypothetical protein